jgi:hypothetical protein
MFAFHHPKVNEGLLLRWVQLCGCGSFGEPKKTALTFSSYVIKPKPKLKIERTDCVSNIFNQLCIIDFSQGKHSSEEH